MAKTSIDFVCQTKGCIEIATHGAILDDRWYEQQFPTGTHPGWEYKPQELLLGCPKHFSGILNRCVLRLRTNIDEFLITAEEEDEWIKLIEKKELVVHGKFG